MCLQDATPCELFSRGGVLWSNSPISISIARSGPVSVLTPGCSFASVGMDGLFGWDCEGADLVLAWQSSVQQWSGVWKHMQYSVTSRLPSTIGTNLRSLKSMSANVCEYGVYSVQIQPRAVAWKL